jgi:Leucine-rich repeat (LRR) protein
LKNKLLASSVANSIARDGNDQSIKIDINNDGEISQYEINSVRKLSLSYSNISDLSGIGNFNLTDLNCSHNSIVQVDLGLLTNYCKVDISANFLTSLVITPNISSLFCYTNPITTITSSGSNHKLTYLVCGDTLINTFDATPYTYLANLFCDNTLSLQSVDVSHALNLKYFGCKNTSIKSLDLSHNSLIKTLDIDNNQISAINTLNMPDLESLKCSYTLISQLNLTNNHALKTLYCTNSQLTGTLDLSPCTQLNYLRLSYNQISGVMDLTPCTELSTAYVDHNQIQSINISGMTNIRTLDCSYNQIQTIVRSGPNNLLSRIYCSHNQITSPSLEHLELLFNLIELDCSYNLIQWFSVPNTSANLWSVDCSHNYINHPLVMPGCHYFDCSFNQIPQLNCGSQDFDILKCNDNNMTSLNPGNAKALYCQNNLLTTLNLNSYYLFSVFENSMKVNCSNNHLVTLSMPSINTWEPYSLELDCSDNNLSELRLNNGYPETALNFANNPNLTSICQDVNELTSTQNLAVAYGYTNLNVSACNLSDEEFEVTNKISVYPNPVKDILYLQAKDGISVVSWRIYNAFGQLVMSEEKAQKAIDVSALNFGNYFITMVSDHGTTHSKFIKQ